MRRLLASKQVTERHPIVTRKIAALSLLFVLAVPACSPTPASAPSNGSPTATPSTQVTSAPPSATPSAAASFDPALAAKLQADLEDSVTKLHYPALAAAVILPDGSSWSGAAGKLDVANGTPATSDTSFAVGSVTKTFIAALVLELAHDGVLSLDDPIGKWLPQLAGDARFAADRVTVRQLLDHTSGIGDYIDNPEFEATLSRDATRRWTPDELISYVGSPTFRPGTDWAYSNTNYILAGMVIEPATRSTVASELRRRILTALGLERTVLQPQEHPVSPTAHGYSESFPGGTAAEPIDVWDGSGLMPNAPLVSAAWTAGGIASTAPDLARWAAALYGGPVLDPASLAQMLDFKRNAGLPHGGTYGLGAMTWLGDSGPVIGHAGGIAGFQSGMWYLTKMHATLVILTNTDGALLDPAYQSLQRIVLEHLGA
ncbi:MAG TPA: serine hydrolase domain-containing protein [Coriobacteriia bacterium]